MSTRCRVVREYIDESGTFRVRRHGSAPEAKAAPLPAAAVEIGVRAAARRTYIGVSRWGETWADVRTTVEIDPLDDPPTANA